MVVDVSDGRHGSQDDRDSEGDRQNQKHETGSHTRLQHRLALGNYDSARRRSQSQRSLPSDAVLISSRQLTASAPKLDNAIGVIAVLAERVPGIGTVKGDVRDTEIGGTVGGEIETESEIGGIGRGVRPATAG
jgi:hypothetical protein